MKKSLLTAALAALCSLGSQGAFAQDEPKPEEKKAAKGSGFAAMDADCNGSVSFDEFKAVRGKKVSDEAKLKAMFDQLDTDKNGSLSKEEYKARKGKGDGKHKAGEQSKKKAEEKAGATPAPSAAAE